MQNFRPAYLNLWEKGLLAERAAQARTHLEACDLCGHQCGADRLAGEKGVCRIGDQAYISSYGPHMGEEDPLRGLHGSGTIFFSSCNLNCVFCQNYDISQTPSGRRVDADALANIMLRLQASGCHNINFVSPSHVVAPILAALPLAAERGLNLPLVYNSGGYDSLSALQLLDGIIDIYMPDMKYADPQIALRYSGCRNYPSVNQAAVKEMHRQVGDLVCDHHGIARRGLLVRHLVMPNDLAGTREILAFLSSQVSKNTYVNIMDQYHPAYQAHRYPELNRRITRAEYAQALQWAREMGLHRLD